MKKTISSLILVLSQILIPSDLFAFVVKQKVKCQVYGSNKFKNDIFDPELKRYFNYTAELRYKPATKPGDNNPQWVDFLPKDTNTNNDCGTTYCKVSGHMAFRYETNNKVSIYLTINDEFNNVFHLDMRLPDETENHRLHFISGNMSGACELINLPESEWIDSNKLP